MSKGFNHIRETFSIEDGSDHELRNRIAVSAATASTALASVITGAELGAEEILYPIAVVSESVSIYHAAKAGKLSYFAGYNAVSRFFERH